MTKRYAIGADGQIESSAIAHMTEGRAQVVEIDSVSQLGALLPLLEPNQAITCGLPPALECALTTRAGADFRPDAVARTNEAFRFPYGPALFPIDVDVDSATFATVGDVMDALEACSPWLQHVHRAARPSSSSYVAGRGLRGVHVYLAVTRGTDIPALKERMQIEQWKAGRGYVKISKSGALLTRQLSDDLVYQPSRLMFEASPVCDGVTRDVPVKQTFVDRPPLIAVGSPVKYKSPEGYLVIDALPQMREIEKRRFDTARRQAKDARRREAKKVAIDYQISNATAQGLDAKLGEKYGLLATRALGDSRLPGTWEIAVKDVGRVKVADILANIESAIGFACADPFDTWRPDLDVKHFTKAEIVRLGDDYGIWSHKLQQFFAFTADESADLSTPIEQAAEKLCGLIEYPDPLDKKAASELNVAHALGLLFADADIALTYNESTYSVDTTEIPAPLALRYALARVNCVRVGKGTLENAIGDVARANPADPWRRAVLALPAWDKTPRLDTFWQDVGAHEAIDEVHEAALRASAQVLFAAIIMRQLSPGAPCQLVPVLIGGGGIGKSRFVHELAAALNAPKPAALSFGEGIKMSMAASVSIVAEIAEMSGLGKREIEEVKSWITDSEDVYRAPYERRAEAHPRRFVLVGSANQDELNRDATGNRRLLAIHFGTNKIDPNWTVDAQQLLAEAKARFCDEREHYTKLMHFAADAVRIHNDRNMRQGVGTVASDLDDLLPPILSNLSRETGERFVKSAAIRQRLDNTPTGRTFSAIKVAQWLKMRAWEARTDGRGMRIYHSPQDWEDIDETPKSALTLVPTSNPFTQEKIG